MRCGSCMCMHTQMYAVAGPSYWSVVCIKSSKPIHKSTSHFPDRWTVYANLDPIFCNASVDFNVPGKRNPPPIKLTATIWTESYKMSTGVIEKYAIEFTDPSGTLASASTPLNTWVQLENFVTIMNPGVTPGTTPKNCIRGSPLVFKDLYDGDSKIVTLRGDQVTIMSSNTNERLSPSLSAIPDPGSLCSAFVLAFMSVCPFFF